MFPWRYYPRLRPGLSRKRLLNGLLPKIRILVGKDIFSFNSHPAVKPVHLKQKPWLSLTSFPLYPSPQTSTFKIFYFEVKAKNGAGLWSDIGYSDGITVKTGSGTDTPPPVISSYSPNPNSFIYKGKTQTLSLTTSDSGDSSNEYQFSVDGTVKQSWSSKTSYSWDTSSLDTKAYILKFEAKDQGGSSSKTAEAYVLREPVSPPDGY